MLSMTVHLPFRKANWLKYFSLISKRNNIFTTEGDLYF